jgi:CheY-like chemotaxis protein
MRHRLLLADDSVTIQRVIELTFADEDIEVIAVGDGQMAIDRLETDPPDIVLADVDMPKLDGYEVAAYVKTRPKLAHIPVVLLTGAFEPVDEARAAEAGSSDVLAKPFEPQMVINRVKQLLGKKREETHDAPPQAQSAQPTAPRPPARSSMPMRDDHASTPDRPKPSAAAGQQPVSLDDYFDQLDAAFSDLQTVAAAPDQEAPASEEDWIDSLAEPVLAPSAPPHAMPMQPAPHPVAASLPSPTATPASPSPPATATLSPAPVLASPSEAVAAATLSHPVAAQPQYQNPEQLIAPPPGPPPLNPAWAPNAPAATAPPPAPPPQPIPAPPTPPAAAIVITDEVIETIVARVLQRMSDRVVRETVSEIVSKTAERAVEEEILRIKAEAP